MADYDQIMKALRNAHAAGDTVAAKRLAAMASAAKIAADQPNTDQKPADAQSPSVASFEVGSGQLQTMGPGPTGRIDPALYEMGAIGRRMAPAEGQSALSGVNNVASGGMDVAKAVAAGLVRGGAALLDAPGTANRLTADVAGAGLSALGASDTVASIPRAVMDKLPLGRPVVQPALRATTGDAMDYRGESQPAKFAGTVAEFVPGAVAFGGAGAANIAKNAVAPGLASEAFGQMFKDTPLEGAARLIGGVAGGAAVDIGTKAFQGAFRASAAKPSLDSLRAAKNAAYTAVDAAGETFSPDELGGMMQGVRAALDDVNYLPEADTVTAAMLKRLDEVSARGATLGQLDKMRQSIWSRYNSTKEPGLLEIIDQIDGLVAGRADTNDLLAAARLANSRYKKAELLDLAFTKAADQTSSTGSGGNILNKYRQAVTSIINNPKQARWFSQDEIDTMRLFVRGDFPENAMRLIGKLSPSGNGLMTALNIGAAGSFGAPALAMSAGATAMKALSDNATGRAAEGLIARVAGQAPQVQARTPSLYPLTSGVNALAGTQPR